MDQTLLLDNYLVDLQFPGFNLTESEIEHLCESVTPDKLKKVNNFVTGKMETILKQHKVPVAKIKAQALLMKKDIVNSYKRGDSSEKVSKIISKKAIGLAKRAVDKAQRSFDEMEFGEKVLIGIIGFVVILIVNSIIGSVIMSLGSLGAIEAGKVTAIIVAPIVEEAAKAYFISQGMPWVGTGIVFGIEMGLYVLQLLAAGGKLVKVLILRITSLLMHFTTTYVQKTIVDKAKEGEEDKAAFIAWVTGVGIHMAWNIFATVANPQISKFLTT